MFPRCLTAATQSTVHVFATRFEGTRTALEAAVVLARGSGSRLLVLVPHIVPYPLPLESPAEPPSFTAERYRTLLHQMRAEAEVRVCLCRHADDVLSRELPAHATVVVGGPAGTWRASREERLARQLTHLGNRVIFAPIEERRDDFASREVFPTHGMFDMRSIGPLVVLIAAAVLDAW